MKKLIKINASLIGVALISLFAFLGFGAIFKKYEISIAIQALTAAFGALFVLLSTKFLMEQEGENRVTSEKRNVVFKENVSDYKRAVQVLIKIMDRKEISIADIQIMLKSHALLILLGDDAAIKAYSRFIEKCQMVLESTDFSNDRAEITTDDEAELWSLMIEFLAAARRGLSLVNDHLIVEDEKNIFRKITMKQANIEQRIHARLPLEHVEDWVKAKNIDYACLSAIQFLIQSFAEIGLDHKITVSQISFFDPKHANERRVLYLERYNKQQNAFMLTFNSTPEEIIMQSFAKKLSHRSARIRNPKNNQYDISFSISKKSIEAREIGDVLSTTKEYIDFFHKKLV